MIDHLLRKEIFVSSDIGKVFDFFSNAQNLELITPKELNFNILSPIPIDMKRGAIIDYSIRIFKIKFKTDYARACIAAFLFPSRYE